MDYNDFRTAWTSFNAKERMTYTLIGGLVAIILIQAIAITNSRERLVLVPPHLDEKAVISWDNANSGYYKSFGVYIASLIGAINPANLDSTLKVLENLFTPSVWSRVQKELIAQTKAEVFRLNGATSWFALSNTVWDPNTRRLYVIGNFHTAYAGRSQESIKPVVYQYDLAVEQGLPRVVNFDSYSDNVPHDAKWHTDHPPTTAQAQ